jgi:lysozyme
MAKYLDVSSFQGADFPFHTAKASGIDGVWIKATEGHTWVSPTLRSQVEAARAAGLRVGFYHFARPDVGNPVSEAIHFSQEVKKYGIKRRDLRPVLDMEHEPASREYVLWARRWNQGVKDRLGVGPLFYSNPDYIKRMNPVQPIGYGLWLASYSSNDGNRHSVPPPEPWSRIAAHQYTSQGHMVGWIGGLDFTYVSVLNKPRILAHPAIGLI